MEKKFLGLTVKVKGTTCFFFPTLNLENVLLMVENPSSVHFLEAFIDLKICKSYGAEFVNFQEHCGPRY